VDKGQQVRGPPLLLAHDALVTEVRQQEHVRRVAIGQPCTGDSVAADQVGAAERGDDRLAKRRDDLDKSRVAAVPSTPAAFRRATPAVAA
jgi:hypothetical protein